MEKIVFVLIALVTVQSLVAMDPTSPILLHQDSGGQGLRRDTNHAIAPEEQRQMDELTVSNPLFEAVKIGTPDDVQKLIDTGLNLDEKDVYGCSPLFLAVKERRLPIVQLLVQNGASVHTKNKDKQRPLHVAVMHQDAAIVEILLQAGAQANISDRMRNTPLHTAVQAKNPDLIKRLMRAGAIIFTKDWHGNTPLYYVEPHSMPSIESQDGDFSLKTILLTTLSDTEIQALKKDMIAMWDQLRMEQRYTEENIREGNTGLVTKVLVRKIEETDQARDPRVWLEYSKPEMQQEFGRAVIEALQKAFEVDVPMPCIIMPKCRYALDTRLWRAVKHDDIAEAKLALDAGACVNMRSSQFPKKRFYKLALLHRAAFCSSPQMVKELIKRGALVNAQGAEQDTPLHHAVGRAVFGSIIKKCEVITVLVECGGDIHAQNEHGISPLQRSLASANKDTSKALLIAVNPHEVTHIIPGLLSLIRIGTSKDVRTLILNVLIQDIIKEKLIVLKQHLALEPSDELCNQILQSINRVIKNFPYLAPTSHFNQPVSE